MASRHGHRPKGKASPTYQSWKSMKARCDNPKTDSYVYYGGRGVVYDPSWREFINFLNALGERPEGTSLDRIDNSLGYVKENCRWATSEEQNNNQGIKKVPSTNTTGYKHIQWNPLNNNWRVKIKMKTKKFDGSFKTLEDAITARDSFTNCGVAS